MHNTLDLKNESMSLHMTPMKRDKGEVELFKDKCQPINVERITEL